MKQTKDENSRSALSHIINSFLS